MVENSKYVLHNVQQAVRIRSARWFVGIVLFSAAATLLVSTHFNDNELHRYSPREVLQSRRFISSAGNSAMLLPAASLTTKQSPFRRVLLPPSASSNSTVFRAPTIGGNYFGKPNASMASAGAGRIILFLHLHKCVGTLPGLGGVGAIPASPSTSPPPSLPAYPPPSPSPSTPPPLPLALALSLSFPPSPSLPFSFTLPPPPPISFPRCAGAFARPRTTL